MRGSLGIISGAFALRKHVLALVEDRVFLFSSASFLAYGYSSVFVGS
jgi:hypothetical protein